MNEKFIGICFSKKNVLFFVSCLKNSQNIYTILFIIIRPGNPQHNILISFIQKSMIFSIYSFSFPHTQSTIQNILMPSPFNTPQTLWLFQWHGILSNFHNNLVRFSNGCAKHKKHKISISFITIINIIFYFIFIFSPFFSLLVSFFVWGGFYLCGKKVVHVLLCVWLFMCVLVRSCGARGDTIFLLLLLLFDSIIKGFKFISFTLTQQYICTEK